VAFSSQANYTDWVNATSRRNLVPTFVDRGVSRGQGGATPTVVNLSFLDRVKSGSPLRRHFYMNIHKKWYFCSDISNKCISILTFQLTADFNWPFCTNCVENSIPFGFVIIVRIAGLASAKQHSQMSTRFQSNSTSKYTLLYNKHQVQRFARKYQLQTNGFSPYFIVTDFTQFSSVL
jgi:hypothetical protein